MDGALRLSKSRILSGLQCERRLWLETYRRELREVDAAQQVVFDSGNELGELARDLYGPGIFIEHVQDIARAIADTGQLLERLNERSTLFEAAFVHDGVVVRADVLKPATHGYDLIEVKGSTSVKNYYIDDCAAQAWVIERSGARLSRTKLAHLNRDFIYQGDGNYAGLLTEDDITARVRERTAQVPKWIERFRAMLREDEPTTTTGSHCQMPYGCPFVDHCRSAESPPPEFPLSILPRGGRLAAQLAEDGYGDLRDVPAERLDHPLHQRIHKATVEGSVYLSPDAGRALENLGYPRYYLDFETIAFAIPRWKGTRPYQQVPFQWSCQIETRDGEVTEVAHLDLTGNSPTRGFAESLLDAIGPSGRIVVYNRCFEASRIMELASEFPDLKPRLLQLIARMFDLLQITRDHYYSMKMMGSWSLKSVLPTIAPELDYGNFDEVVNGADAQLAYREAIRPTTSSERKAELDSSLRRYCANDTLGMVKINEYMTNYHSA